MKKNITSLLYAAIVGQFVLFCLMTTLADKYPIIYIIMGVLNVSIVFTAFFAVKHQTLSDQEKDQKNEELLAAISQKNIQLEDKLTEALTFQNRMSELVDEYCTTSSEKNQELIDSLGQEINSAICGLKSTSENSILDLCNKTTEKLSDIKEEFSKLIGNTQEVITGQVISTNKNITELINKSDSIIEKQEEKLELLIKQTNQSIVELLYTVEKGITTMQSKSDEAISSEMKEISGLVSDFNNMSESRLSKMSDEYSGMLEKIRNEITSSYDRFKESLDIYSQDIVTNNAALSESFTKLTEKNTNAIIESNSSIMQSVSEKLTEKNSEIISEQNECFSRKMEEISIKYDGIIELHVGMIAKQTSKSIEQFITSANQVFESNAEKTEKLIATEVSFHEEYKAQNDGLRVLLNNCFIHYEEVVGNLVSDLESKIAGYLGKEEEAYIVLLKNLSDELKSYSDSFVQKSAEAVTEGVKQVQKENSLKLERMSDSVKLLAETDNAFAETCSTNNRNIVEEINRLISQNETFIADIQKISDDSIREVNNALCNHIISMREEIGELNKENVQAFNDSMIDYRQCFVSESAQAIANVQRDNVNAISEAYSKISELANMISKIQEEYKQLSSDLLATVNYIEDTIKDGNVETKKYYDTQKTVVNNSIESIKDIIKSVFESKLGEANEKYIEILKIINILEKSLEQNSASYSSTLKQIIDSQNAMKALNDRDVKILERLAGK